MESCDTGDILLFKTKSNVTSWLQRKFTKSEFDHVGLVLKYSESSRDIFLLESVGECGVRLRPWHEVRQAIGSYYSRICFRGLSCVMSRSQLKSLNEFRKRVVGSKYAVTASKLLRYTSNHFTTENDEGLDE